MAEIFLFLISLVVMFIPSVIAFNRKLKYRWVFLLANVLTGWLIISWIILCFWTSLSKAVETPEP